MRYRVVFLAGVAVGFIAGSRAGRERYDQIVKYSRKAWQSPPAQRAYHAASAKAEELSKSAASSAVGKAAELGKSAAAKAPGVARTARERVARINVPGIPTPKGPSAGPGSRFRPASPATPPAPARSAGHPSVNGNSHAATHNED
ncbi:MAG TPA: hypothetical protein VH478_10640 [Trebonia sp.]|jgi:hypothetical protein|nr:hypothetical protein [Trebonia sp.]